MTGVSSVHFINVISLSNDIQVIVRPLSTVEYTSIASVSTVGSGLNNLIHGRCCLTALQRHPYLGCSRLAGCVHLSVKELAANGRVSYKSLYHCRLYCRDREKK